MKSKFSLTLLFGMGMALLSGAAVLVHDDGFHSVYAPVTNSFKTFNVVAGDIIAVQGSGNNAVIRDGSNLSLGGTAGLTWADTGSIHSSAGVHYWYGTVATDGTVTLTYGHDQNAHVVLGAYQLRSDTGKALEFLQAPLITENDSGVASLDLVYSFGDTVSQGILIESYASYNAFQQLAVTSEAERSGKFGVGHAFFSGISDVARTYTIANDGSNQIALGGLAFAEAQGDGDPSMIAANDARIIFQGSEYITRDAAGAYIQRHSDSVLSLSTAEKGFNTQKAKTTTGISLLFKTDSASVDVKFTHDLSAGIENRNSRFGVYEDGQFAGSHYFLKTESNLTFTVNSSTPGTPSVFRIVLPNWSKPDFRGLELDVGATLYSYTPPVKKKHLVFGDSISHGTGQGSSYQTWPWIVSELLDVDLFNLAVGGGKVSVPAAEMLSEFPAADVISILIGYNDLHGGGKTSTQYGDDLEAMLDAVRTHQPQAKIVCISPLFTTKPTNDQTGETIQAFRQEVYDQVAARQAAGDERIYLIRGEEITSETDLNDTVHLSEAGAANFATNLFQQMDPIVNPPKPNVLFIAIDDINPIMGSYGNTLIQTPHMDALANRGMVFLNAHCQWAVCGPSRASLMTGLMPEQTGVTGFKKMRGDGVVDSRDNAKGLTNLVTIPQHFIEYGYATAASGKINDNRCVGSINPGGTINEDGGSVDDPPSWSHGFLNPGGVNGSSAYNPESGKNLKRAAESIDQPGIDFVDGAIATAGLEQLEMMATNQPFFLGVGFKKPHLPFLAPKANWDQYDRDDFTPHPFQTEMENVTAYTFNNVKEMRDNYYLDTDSDGNAMQFIDGILPEEQQKELLHGYYASISHVDDQVGRVLDRLDSLGLTSNTIVVLWGDHGFHLGDHNEWGKHTNLEQATRVPFIISAPGYTPGKTEAPVGLLDIYPTLCELAGLPIPEQPTSHAVSGGRPLAGKSLVSIVGNSEARVQTGVMNHYGGGTYGYAFRTERYRYTEWINSSGTILARELYDYLEDPIETVNLAVYPEYEALMFQFSEAARNEAGGCDRLKSSTPPPAPSDKTLSGLGISHDSVSWPAALNTTYNLLSKTNLQQTSWATNQSGLTVSPALFASNEPHLFFKVELAD